MPPWVFTATSPKRQTWRPRHCRKSRLYSDCLRAMGCKVSTLDLGAHGQAQLVLRGSRAWGHVALMPGGPRWRRATSACDRRDALSEMGRNLRQQRIVALITNSTAADEEELLLAAGHVPVLTGGFEARLDLTVPKAERRARLRSKWRNRLTRAETAGLRIDRTQFVPARDRWLLDAETAQRRSRGYRGLPLTFVEAAAATAPRNVRLFTASHKGKRVAAMLFLIHQGAATYHIGHTTRTGRDLAAHNLLLWTASNWLADMGVERLDLGPVETERGAGLARFKLGTGAKPAKRGASCLYTRATAPLGRAVAALSRRAARGFAARNGRSCR